jgi:hypothetical protein
MGSGVVRAAQLAQLQCKVLERLHIAVHDNDIWWVTPPSYWIVCSMLRQHASIKSCVHQALHVCAHNHQGWQWPSVAYRYAPTAASDTLNLPPSRNSLSASTYGSKTHK